ncbi:MAG: ABC transporter substrate-binding protein [Desulfobacterales bacterium]|nr:MAG: ABC transporter substrate-binding protein [Desulfobacterales bacterium]
MNFMNRFFHSFVIVTILVFPVLFIDVDKAIADIRIGIIESFSGPLSQLGKDTNDGVKWAADKINSEGGILNQQIHFQLYDYQTKPRRALEIAHRLAAEGVDVIIGPYGSRHANKIVSDVAERKRIPFFVSNSNTDFIFEDDNGKTKELNFTFRLLPGENYASEHLFKYLTAVSENANDRINSFALSWYHPTFDRLAYKTKTAAKKYGIQLVLEHPYEHPLEPNWSIYLRRARQYRPEAIFQFGFIHDSTTLIQKVREFAVRPKAIAGCFNSAFSNPGYVKKKENLFLGCMDINYWWNPKVVATRKLRKEYRRKFQKEMSNIALLTYTAVHVLRDAMNSINTSDPQAVAARLHQGSFSYDFLAQREPIKFDQSGRNINAEVVLLQVSNPDVFVIHPDPFAETDPVYPMRW